MLVCVVPLVHSGNVSSFTWLPLLARIFMPTSLREETEQRQAGGGRKTVSSPLGLLICDGGLAICLSVLARNVFLRWPYEALVPVDCPRVPKHAYELCSCVASFTLWKDEGKEGRCPLTMQFHDEMGVSVIYVLGL